MRQPDQQSHRMSSDISTTLSQPVAQKTSAHTSITTDMTRIVPRCKKGASDTAFDQDSPCSTKGALAKRRPQSGLRLGASPSFKPTELDYNQRTPSSATHRPVLDENATSFDATASHASHAPTSDDGPTQASTGHVFKPKWERVSSDVLPTTVDLRDARALLKVTRGLYAQDPKRHDPSIPTGRERMTAGPTGTVAPSSAESGEGDE